MAEPHIESKQHNTYMTSRTGNVTAKPAGIAKAGGSKKLTDPLEEAGDACSHEHSLFGG